MIPAISYTVCDKCNSLNRVPFDFPAGKSPICGQCKSSLPIHNGVSDLNVSGLDKISNNSPLPVVVDFWAPWCGPCRAFAPTFIEAARKLKGQVIFGKVDTQANPNAGQKFSIKGIPTLLLFKNSKEVGRISGALGIGELINWLRQR